MSIFEQPDIRSNTKTGGMMRKINLTLTGVLAVLAFVFTLGAGPIHAQPRTFAMPACPITAHTVDPTKTPLNLPNENPLGETFTVGGTVQVTDQTGGTISLIQYAVVADPTKIMYARTVKTLQHATATFTFDKGCTKTDQYGSNNCGWTWGQPVTEAYGGELEEDITSSGKFVVDLTVNTTEDNKVQFTCPVCGGTCTIPGGILHQKGLWDLLMTQLFQFSFFLTTPLPSF